MRNFTDKQENKSGGEEKQRSASSLDASTRRKNFFKHKSKTVIGNDAFEIQESEESSKLNKNYSNRNRQQSYLKAQSFDCSVAHKDIPKKEISLSNVQTKRKTFKHSRLGLSLDNNYYRVSDENLNTLHSAKSMCWNEDHEVLQHHVQVHHEENTKKEKPSIPKLASIDEIIEYEQELAALDALLGNVTI